MTTLTTEEELALIKKNKASGAGIEAPAPDPAPPAPLPKTYADIDAELGLPPRETGLAPLPDEDAGFFEIMGAAWRAETIKTDAWNDAAIRKMDLVNEMFSLLPKAEQERVGREFVQGAGWARSSNGVVAAAARAAATSADEAARWAQYPLTTEALDQRITAARVADLDEAEAVLGQKGGAVAEFLGTGGRAMTDETSLMLMPFGATGSLWRKIASEAVLGGIGEAAVLPREYRVAEELGLPDPSVASRVGMGVVFGAGFAGALEGLGKGFRALKSRVDARSASVKETLPEGVDRIDHEHAIEAAEAELRGDQTVTERLGLSKVEGGARAEAPAKGTLGDILSDPAPGILPPIRDDAPPNWERIRNGIFAGESGGDYNALFGYQNRKGGKFSNIKLTEMTVDQAIAFADPQGPYGQWVKTQVGRVATPMGAYQIVGTTLRAMKRELGLRGDEVMTPEFQEFLGQQIYLRQGTGAWEGYKGPRDSFSPAPSDRDAPDMGGTVRGYTGQGQVAVGDDMRIDVDYEVVDYRSLIRASGDLQPRDRSRINSDEWVASTAARLDPAQLMPSPTADRGTPIVGPDNVIESGNGRSMAIARAYERHPDRAEAYRGAIEAAGFQIPDGVTQPVLVARRRTELTPDQRRQMVVDAQDSGVAQMTPTEVARATARNLGSSILSRLDPAAPLASDANGAFVRAALATLPRSARNAMFDPGGALNALGQRQLKEALFARAWPDPDILARYTEGAPAELKTLIEALETAAPSWAALRADIEAGLVTPDMDISPFVLDAMRLIGAAREVAAAEQARRAIVPKAQRAPYSVTDAIQELLDEVDLIQGAVSPLTAALVRKMWPNGRAAPAEDVAAFLSRYADEARKAGQAGGMFDAPGPRDVLRTVDPETFKDLPEDFGQARGFATRPASEAPAEAVRELPDQGFDQGARSPEVEAVHAEIEAELRGEEGPFGPVFQGYSDDPAGAIKKIMQEGKGEVPDAFVHPDLGPIALVYGKLHPDNPSRDYGLIHILQKHGQEMLDSLPDALRKGVATKPHNGRVYLDVPGDPLRRTIVKLEFDNVEKQWVTSSHMRPSEGARQLRTTDVPTASASPRVPDATGRANDSATDAPLQPEDTGPTALVDDIAAARAELGDFAEIEIDLPDGTTARAGDVLADLDADRAADAVLQACAITQGGAQ